MTALLEEMLDKGRAIQGDPLALKFQVLDEPPETTMEVLTYLGRAMLVHHDMILRLAQAVDELQAESGPNAGI